MQYAGEVPPEASAAEDTRVWVGRIASGREADHATFLDWLAGPEAESIFMRRRLTEYTVHQQGDIVTVVFKAPRTGDPRVMIDFLRYPGMWPEFWQFDHAAASLDAVSVDPSTLKVHWRRPAS
ncbi:MAG TPA: hypothetical protein VGQ62_01810 [Chloroflexota bacterium]|nr:hypothetical protein [Chloroflexota bacterium]